MHDEHVLDPAAETVERAHERVLGVIRAVRAIESREAAAPLRAADPGRLEGFRRLLHLRESDPGALHRLAEVIITFEPQLADRLSRLAGTLPDKRFGSIHEVLAKRSYRRVHSAALGGGAAVIWSFGREPEALWLHANAVGLLTMVACQGDEELRDHAFAAGLLHNLGRLALVSAGRSRKLAPVPALRPDLAGEPVYAEVVGRAAMRELRLPAELVEAASPCGTRSPGPSHLSRLVGAACLVAHRFDFVDDLSSEPDVSPDALALHQVLRAMFAAGGPEWVAARLGAPLVVAREGLASVFDVA